MASKEINKEFKQEMKKVSIKLKELFKPFEDLYETYDTGILDTEIMLDDTFENLVLNNNTKLKVKEKKELEAKLRKESLEYLKKNHPKLVKQFENNLLFVNGVGQFLDGIHSKLQDFENEIDEIESMAEELEERKGRVLW